MIDIKPEMVIINGYKIYLFKSINNTFYIKANVKNGYITETKKNCGINHLLEHILTNSWKKCVNNKCSSYWKQRSVHYNAETNDVNMSYFLFGLKEYNYEMIDYIIQIMTDPIMNSLMIDNEKNAVLNELLIYNNDNNYELNKRFYEEFFCIEGLKYTENYKQQIKNLSTFGLQELKNMFKTYYNNSNISFSLIGKYNKKEVLNCFKKHLKVNEGYKYTIPKNIFTFNNTIMHVYSKNTNNYIIKIAFPVTQLIDSVYLNETLKILKIIMFERLRTSLKLIYSIDISCPEYIQYIVIDVEVDKENVKQLLHELIIILDFYKKNNISKELFESILLNNKLYYYKKHNNNDDIYTMNHYMKQYNNENKKIYTLKETYNKVNNITPEIIKTISKTIFDFDKMFIMYQSKYKL